MVNQLKIRIKTNILRFKLINHEVKCKGAIVTLTSDQQGDTRAGSQDRPQNIGYCRAG
jgi:hypothetical protein